MTYPKRRKVFTIFKVYIVSLRRKTYRYSKVTVGRSFKFEPRCLGRLLNNFLLCLSPSLRLGARKQLPPLPAAVTQL